MFDGVKIRCENVKVGEWENHPELDFTLPVSAKTGEILPESIRAKYRELLFRITPSRKLPGYYWHFIEGSLHKFANGGAANTNDFGFDDMAQTVNSLCQDFGINPEYAPLENIEFGVNIPLPIPAKEFMKCLVCLGGSPFVEMNREKKHLGKVVKRQQYTLKLYDKGKQAETGDTNILRVEIHVHRMEFVREYGITHLGHITDKDRVQPLGELLGSVLGNAIYYDESIKEKNMTEAEQYRLKDFKNPKWWDDLDKRRRYYYREVYAKMMEKHGANRVFLNVVKEVEKKWLELLEYSADSLDFLTGQKSGDSADSLDFLTVRMNGYKVQLNNNVIYTYFAQNLEKLPNFEAAESHPKAPVAKRSFVPFICASCGRDITGQKTGSRYCSEKRFGKTARKCRDKGRYKERPSRRIIEAARLEILKGYGKSRPILVTVFATRRTETGKRVLQPICIWNGETGGPVHLEATKPKAAKVRLLMHDGRVLVFTWSRAKTAIEIITKIQ